MFYKIIKDNKVIDVIDSLTYVKISPKSGKLLICGRAEASGLVSSNGREVWHLKGFYPFPKEGYETVEIFKIDKEEYHQLKMLNGKTPEEIIDEYTLMLIEGGLL
jgi:hypothetical protein